jgi:hypothetical protein
MATYVCPTCSQDDFEWAVYNQAYNDGDVIILPAGTATWGNSSRPNNGRIFMTTKDVTVIGQGDATVITMDNSGSTYAGGVINLWAPTVFRDVKIIGATGSPVTVFNFAAYTNPATGYQMRGGFRLSNITYEGHSDGYFAFIQQFVDYGVIDNCRISSDVSYAELIFMRGRTDAWQLPNTWGTYENIFIEDCEFPVEGYLCDANANARMVLRFNRVTGIGKADGHGFASNSPARGVRNMEVYHNEWLSEDGGSAANIEMRGGAVMVFNNSSRVGWLMMTDYGILGPWPNYGFTGNVTAGNPSIVTTDVPNPYETGFQVDVQTTHTTPFINETLTATVTGPTTLTVPKETTVGGALDWITTVQTLFNYPLPDQIGEGQDGEAREPGYVFGNTQDGSPWARTSWNVWPDAITNYRIQVSNPSATFDEADVIESNRDFFSDAGFDVNTGVTVGTRAEMDAMTPIIDGYGFWVTDEGSWNNTVPDGQSGQLYRWDGAAWELFYTPYQYPHPLRNDPSRPGNPSTAAMAGMM